MKSNAAAGRYLKKLPDFQRRAAEKILAQSRPYKPAPSILKQWFVWLGFSLVIVAVTLAWIGPQRELWDRLTQPSSGGFLFLAFLGSALAAWGGIASSMPGSEPGPVQRISTGALLVFLFSMPFLFFSPGDWGALWTHNMEDGWFCFRTVALVALPSWGLMGWMVSRNASFHPGWTGAWLGVSAFLLGSGAIQTHCAHWESCHMLIDHLVPMILLIFIPIWIGSFWFSRWRK